jgi:hypothetical protein
MWMDVGRDPPSPPQPCVLFQFQRGKKDAVIVAELPSSQEDAVRQVQKTWLNDSVQPEQLQAMVLAHLAEDSDVGAVLDEVVSDYGSNMVSRSISESTLPITVDLITVMYVIIIFLRSSVAPSVGAYATPGEAFDFWELQARAQQLGDIVIAQKCAEHENKWELNPLNKDKPVNWSEEDQVLVLTRPQTAYI